MFEWNDMSAREMLFVSMSKHYKNTTKEVTCSYHTRRISYVEYDILNMMMYRFSCMIRFYQIICYLFLVKLPFHLCCIVYMCCEVLYFPSNVY